MKLAGLDLPPGLDGETAALIRSAIAHAFIRGFRAVNLICVALALASALVARFMIPAKTE
jgi:hypothetical protein